MPDRQDLLRRWKFECPHERVRQRSAIPCDFDSFELGGVKRANCSESLQRFVRSIQREGNLANPIADSVANSEPLSLPFLLPPRLLA